MVGRSGRPRMLPSDAHFFKNSRAARLTLDAVGIRPAPCYGFGLEVHLSLFRRKTML